MERMRRRVREMKGIEKQFTVISFQLSEIREQGTGNRKAGTEGLKEQAIGTRE